MSEFIARIRRHWNDPASHDRRIATGFLWVALFVFVGKMAGAAKEMAIAWRYGISDTVDAYVFVFNLVAMPVSIWTGLLSAVLVPLVIKVRYETPEQLRRFHGELLAFTLLLGIAALLISCSLLPPLFRSGLLGLSPSVVDAALAMARPLSWVLPFGAVIALMSAWTMASGRHRNSLLEAVPALTILTAIVLPEGWIPDPLVWGTIVGYLFHVVSLTWPLARSGEASQPALGFKAAPWPAFWNAVQVLVFGYVLMSLTTIVDQFFAAHLESGAIATLGYANRILALILGIGGLAINRAMLPVFSEVAAKGSGDRLAARWATWMFLGGLGVVVIGWPLAHLVVKVIFERGAFTATNTSQVAAILQLLLLQVPFYFYGLVMVSALTSRKAYFAVTVTGIIGVLARPAANAVLVPRMGLEGIAVSAAICYLATALYMTFRIRRSW